MVILDELMERRNNIVHEGKIYAMELSELETYYDVIDGLLKALASALKKIDISVIDDAQMLSSDIIFGCDQSGGIRL